MKKLVFQMIEKTWSVPPKSIDAIFKYLEDGKTLYVHTYVKNIVITQKTLEKFRKIGAYLLKEEGDGYRLQNGKGSVYLLPGQLKFGD